MRESFLAFCRLYKVEARCLKPFKATEKKTIAIGVRFCAELKDQFVGQLASMLMPHSSREQLRNPGDSVAEFGHVKCLLGWLNYLLQLTWIGSDTYSSWTI